MRLHGFRPLDRGETSILAAFVLVVILAGAGLFFQSFAPASPQSQTAAGNAATTQALPTTSVPCDSGRKVTSNSGQASTAAPTSNGTKVGQVQMQCLPGCVYIVTPGPAKSVPIVATDPKVPKSNPNQPVPQYCTEKYCFNTKTDKSDLCVKGKQVEIGFDDSGAAANAKLTSDLAQYQKQALAQGVINTTLVAGTPDQVKTKVGDYYALGGDQSTLDNAFKAAQDNAQTGDLHCDLGGCVQSNPSSDNAQIERLTVAQQASDTCAPPNDPSACNPSVPLNPETKDGTALTPGTPDNAPIAPLGGCKDNVCYATSQKDVDALNAKGYTCQAAGDYSVCTAKGTTPPWTGQQPPCNTGKCPPANPGPGNAAVPDNNHSSGLPSGFGSILSGLAKGLMHALFAPTPPPAAPAQACSTDPNAYAQQQQQYQQQLQQYNYQLQQYQYQQYSGGYGGYGAGGNPPPAQPTPCTPSNQQQCSVQPPQPSPATCTSGSWQPIYSGNCIVNWQCSDLGAQLSCQPQTADVGMSIAISYSCAQGTASGSGFNASGQSGTSTAIVAPPPAGTNTATYSLTCTNGSQTSGAQCSIQVSQPGIVLVANPATIHSGETSLIGWVTGGMQACVISSPTDPAFTAQNSSNTSVNGTATTLATSTTTGYLLHCQTLSGGTKDATTTVTVQ